MLTRFALAGHTNARLDPLIAIALAIGPQGFDDLVDISADNAWTVFTNRAASALGRTCL